MQDFSDRPQRVAGEFYGVHLLRMARWLGNLRLIPARREWHSGAFGALRRFRVRDLLTRPGQLLLWGAVMVALLGFRNRTGYPLLGGAVALALVATAILAGQVLRPRVQLTRRVLGPGTVGRALQSEIVLRNRSRLPLLDASVRELRIPTLQTLTPDAAHQALLARVPAGGQVTVMAEAVPRRRGVLRLDGIAVHSAFPFFLSRATSRCASPAQVPILPAAIPLDLPPLRGLAARLAGSGDHRQAHSHGVEYQESRLFQVGDSPLRLDHRASARRGQLLTRVYGGSEDYLPGSAVLVVTAEQPGFARWQRRPHDTAALDRRLGVALELTHRLRAEQLAVRAIWMGAHWSWPADDGALWTTFAACSPQHAPALPASPPATDALCLLVTDARPEVQTAATEWAQTARAAGCVVLHFLVTHSRRRHGWLRAGTPSAAGPGGFPSGLPAGTYVI